MRNLLQRIVAALNSWGITLAFPLGVVFSLGIQSVFASEPSLESSSFGQSFNPGVVYIGVPDIHTSWQELPKIKAQGFRHVNVPADVDDHPSPGSDFRDRLDHLLDWCDRNGLDIWIEHNLRYGEPGRGGDMERAVIDPVGEVAPIFEHWLDTLKDHRCVAGIGLGNETGAIHPDPGLEDEMPQYLAAWRQWVVDRHGSLNALNAAWGSDFEDLSGIEFPGRRHHTEWMEIDGDRVPVQAIDSEDPGYFDFNRFAKVQFGRYYSRIFDELFQPALGPLGYTSETPGDPYLFRACTGCTVQGWDDGMANWPAWVLKVIIDTDPRPAFNSEIHLYHDLHQFGDSIEMTRYRYLTDALLGQWLSSSYRWDNWHGPRAAQIHSQTPGVLAQVKRLEPLMRQFHSATRESRTAALITEPLWEFSRYQRWLANPPLGRLYAALGSTGQNWRFVLDLDLTAEAEGLDTLVIWSHDTIPLPTVKVILSLPDPVQVHWTGPWPTQTEYGRPLPADLLSALAQRCILHEGAEGLVEALADPDLPRFYHRRTAVPFVWWHEGHLNGNVEYPQVETRRAVDHDGMTIVALVNHTRNPVVLPKENPLPWLNAETMKAIDVTAEPPEVVYPEFVSAGRIKPRPDSEGFVLGPLEVRFYRYVERHKNDR
jgi:hypothetical protein